ncbi:TPR Domain containing protein [Aphelenchoides avenae]|nr:TPR Domain containing protein [Aphelenchus avenae]
MSAESSGVRQCWIDIAKAESTGDYEKALKAANKLIKQYPKETQAFKCKLIALIQLGQFDEALALLKKTPNHQMGDVSFEKAYIYYRKNQNDEALIELDKADGGETRVLELRGQLLYRLERFQDALEAYTKLIRSHSDEYDETRRANLVAVVSQLESLGVRQEPQADLDTFEQLYNGACHLIECERYSEAVALLDKAQGKLLHVKSTILTTLVEDGLTDEEIEEELAIILIQKAFSLQKLGKPDEALKIYVSSYRRKRPSIGVEQPANVASQCDKTKLSRRQRRTLLFNQALVHLLSNQHEPCKKALKELEEQYGQLDEAALLEAALFVRQKKVQAALEAVGKLAGRAEAQLLAAQIHINNGNFDEGVEILSKLPSELVHSAALTNLVVSVCCAQGRVDDAVRAINSAISDADANKDSARLECFLNKSASLSLAHNRADEAIKVLERLRKNAPNDVSVLCRLIKAYGTSPKAAEYVKELERLDKQGSSKQAEQAQDVDELEAADWVLYGQRYKQKKETKKDAVEDTEIVTGKLRKRKRKRKVRLPKNYDPNVAPDPERWIPKRERAAYKKKVNKKYKDRDIGRGTQGAAASANNDKIDYSKPGVSGNVVAEHSSPKPTSPMAEGPRQQRPAAQAKKPKKKKGGKW